MKNRKRKVQFIERRKDSATSITTHKINTDTPTENESTTAEQDSESNRSTKHPKVAASNPIQSTSSSDYALLSQCHQTQVQSQDIYNQRTEIIKIKSDANIILNQGQRIPEQSVSTIIHRPQSSISSHHINNTCYLADQYIGQLLMGNRQWSELQEYFCLTINL